jgi:putative SOS response-associated peptidase YedK
MCNLYSITTNQAAIIALFRVVNRYVGNLAPMPGVFPDYPAPVVRNAGTQRELTMMRWGMPPPPKFGGPPVTNFRNTSSPHWRGWLKPENRCLVPANSFSEYAPETNPATGKKDVIWFAPPKQVHRRYLRFGERMLVFQRTQNVQLGRLSWRPQKGNGPSTGLS